LLAREQPDYVLDGGVAPKVYTSSGDSRIRRAYAIYQVMAVSSLRGEKLLPDWQWPAAVWRRGFVEAVSLRYSDFMRLAKPVFKLHPVMRVQLKDKKPSRAAMPRFSWRGEGGTAPVDFWPTDSFVLPRVIFDHLGDGSYEYQFEDWRHFDSEEQALAALSQACVAFGISTRKEVDEPA
jgi:hypothetical protein